MPQQPTVLGRILGFAIGTTVLILAFVFSLVVFAVLLVLALIAIGFLLWKTRALRRQQADSIIETTEYHEVHEQLPAIEGESHRVNRERPGSGRREA